MTGFDRARAETIRYHQEYYDRFSLFEPGSWLGSADPVVLGLLELVAARPGCRVLDLGCGVGRNAIPVAQAIHAAGGQVVCVDMIEMALAKLRGSAEKYGVAAAVEIVHADNEAFEIRPESYDLILAISVLEHCSSFEAITRIVRSIAAGTKSGGYNRLEFTADRKVTDKETGADVPTAVETRLSESDLVDFLGECYAGWATYELSTVDYSEDLERDGRLVFWQSRQVCLTTRKP